MDLAQAVQIIEDEVLGKGGHSWLEVIQAAIVLGQYVISKLPAPHFAAGNDAFKASLAAGMSDAQHIALAKAEIGGAAPGKVNWGNILKIILTILGGLGGILGGGGTVGS